MAVTDEALEQIRVAAIAFWVDKLSHADKLFTIACLEDATGPVSMMLRYALMEHVAYGTRRRGHADDGERLAHRQRRRS
jgi:hypothetical protein